MFNKDITFKFTSESDEYFQIFNFPVDRRHIHMESSGLAVNIPASYCINKFRVSIRNMSSATMFTVSFSTPIQMSAYFCYTGHVRFLHISIVIQ
jgi:hypothetical protein